MLLNKLNLDTNITRRLIQNKKKVCRSDRVFEPAMTPVGWLLRNLKEKDDA